MFLDPLTWAIIFLVLGLGFALLELVIPSGGILAFLSCTAFVGSIYMAFRHENSTVGVGFVVGEVIGISALAVFALKWWPRTKLGQRFMPHPPTHDNVLPDNPELQTLQDLIGKNGIAKTVMLPSGAVSIDGRTYNAISEGMAIEIGLSVRVINVQGTRIVVRPIDPSHSSSENPPKAASHPSGDILSQSIEELGLDSLEDPLA